MPLRRERPRWFGRSPFAAAAPAIVSAAGFAVAALVWIVAGAWLPGGRWVAVHLFTLGVLTPLVWAFSRHFAGRFCPAPAGEQPGGSGAGAGDHPARTSVRATAALDLAVIAMITGWVAGVRPLLAVGATGVVTVVVLGYVRIRRARRGAPEARFAWIVRLYERAHGSFVHGAVLGIVLGLGLAPGLWFAGVRLAHMHAMILGWGGITLLGTLVVFGPGIARTRMEPDADTRAAGALRMGTTGLTVAVLALIVTGVGGTVGSVARLLAAAGLAVLAWGAWRATGPVLRAARTATSGTTLRWPVVAICAWIPLLLAVDAVVVGTGASQWFDVLGMAALVAVLGRALLTVLVFLAPVLRGRTPAARETIRSRAERSGLARSLAIDVGVLAVALGVVLERSGVTAAGAAGGVLVTLGWALVVVSALAHLSVLLWPVRPA